MKPPLYEDPMPIRNAVTGRKKVAHDMPIKNQASKQKGGESGSKSYICNESNPQGYHGRKGSKS
jgi:hypothetical protein